MWKRVALERLSASRPTQDAGNWHSAAQTAKFGPRTYKNSESTETGQTSNIEITPQVFSPMQMVTNDVVNILYHFDTPGYVANISIYDARGREVRKLVRNVLLGNDGTFTWDGINEDHGKAAIGIYVFFIEIFNQSGDVNKYKRPVCWEASSDAF
jgi:flagellar hook assembly protein FlgD